MQLLTVAVYFYRIETFFFIKVTYMHVLLKTCIIKIESILCELA